MVNKLEEHFKLLEDLDLQFEDDFKFGLNFYKG